MTRIVVEGWRFIPHSWAVVNQSLCLELLKHTEIKLYHRDMPYWSTNWQPTMGLFPETQEALLQAVPEPPGNLQPNAVLRIDFPYRLQTDPPSVPTFVWGTTEFGLVEDHATGNRRPAREVIPTTEAVIITPSHWSREGFLRSGAPPDKVVVVACGADTNVFKPAAPDERVTLRKQLGWEGKFVVLNVSAMTTNKGILELMKCIAALSDQFPQLWLALKGTDALYPSKHFAQQYFGHLTQAESGKIAARLQYLGGTLTVTAMASLYQAADAYVSPYYAEGFNLPVLEAAACGLPIICTKGGATDDFTHPDFAMRIDSKLAVINPEGRRMLEPNLDHLITLLASVIANSALRSQALTAGPEFVNARFTWKHVVDRLLQHLIPNN